MMNQGRREIQQASRDVSCQEKVRDVGKSEKGGTGPELENSKRLERRATGLAVRKMRALIPAGLNTHQ